MHHKPSEYFYIILNEFTALIESHTYQSRPPRSDVAKLRTLYALIQKVFYATISEQSLTNKIVELEDEIIQAKEMLVSNFCPVKEYSIITDSNGQKFKITNRSVYISSENGKNTSRYYYEGNYLRKDGKVGKHINLIQVKINEIKIE